MPRIAALLSGLLLGGCSVFGVRGGTEEPRWDRITQVGRVEIRRYAPRIAAETEVAGDEEAARGAGFRRVAAYIFGANRDRAKIAMTAPVAQSGSRQSESRRIAMTAPVAQAREAGGRWTIRFFMPARYTIETLPVPTDPRVRLVPVPAETYAVLRFSGLAGPAQMAARDAELLGELHASAWTPSGPVVAWFYDPPWTLPPLRRNEVAVPVSDNR